MFGAFVSGVALGVVACGVVVYFWTHRATEYTRSDVPRTTPRSPSMDEYQAAIDMFEGSSHG